LTIQNELEHILTQLRQLFAAEYTRGEQNAIKRIMQAASQPSEASEAISHNNVISEDRAPRGSVGMLIDRVLTERGSQGATAAQIWESSTQKVSYSGVRLALNRGQDKGRYRYKDGRWFLPASLTIGGGAKD
jgi:hypothetical protein